MNTLITLVALLIAAALQAWLPTMGWLGGLRLELLPGLVAYGALTLPSGRALLLAISAGFLQDSLSAAPFGMTALVYGVAAMVLAGMREAFDRELPWVQIGAGTLTSAAVSLAALCVVGFSAGGLLKLAVLAAVSGIVTVFLFLAADFWLLPTRQ